MRFSILIPSWNNLPYLKLCVESIQKNSAYDHQILIHINGGGTDGTLEWVKEKGLEYTISEENIGVCWSLNLLRTKVKTDYICFVNDDMYLLPGWDVELSKVIEGQKDNMFFFSCTSIQPNLPCQEAGSGVLANYGDSVETFDEARLLDEYETLALPDWNGATMPPNVVHRDVWDYVGGYSIEFSPGMASDLDFTAKLMYSGVKEFRGLGKSLVYHFEQKSTARIRKNDGNFQFLLKWGTSISTMRKYVERRGTPYETDAYKKRDFKTLRRKAFRYYLKAVVQLIRQKRSILDYFWEK
ncbi:MAG: glycosyltransferase family 2 protein [Bacteroidales bacterium]|mgnify:FL=1|nr:glycosyltransferase family 2 protein [Bacteroidales bacterium]